MFKVYYTNSNTMERELIDKVDTIEEVEEYLIAFISNGLLIDYEEEKEEEQTKEKE